MKAAPVLLCLALAGSLVGVGFALRVLWRAWDSQHWPQVGGVVAESSVEGSDSSDGGQSWRHRLVYHYRVGGVEYTGKRSCMGVQNFGGPYGFAQRMVERFPKGAHVEVFYHPADPGDAVLLPGIQKISFVPLLFSLLFFCVLALGGGMYYCFTS